MSRIPKDIKAALANRSAGICEVCESARAVHPHHRKLQVQGGEHTLANLIAVCAWCHAAIHDDVDTSSVRRGYIVRRPDDPADVPWRSLLSVL